MPGALFLYHQPVKMKKTTLVLTLLLTAAAAQALTPAADSSAAKETRWSLGINGGWAQNRHSIDMSYMKDIEYDKTANGFSAGLQACFYPVKWFALRADLDLVQKNYNMNHVFIYYGNRTVTSTYTTNDYLSLPIVVQFSAGKMVRVRAFGGGYVGLWLRSHRKGTSYSCTYTIYGDEASNAFDSDMEFSTVRDNRFDAGLTWGAGLSGIIAKRIEVGVELRWYYGLTDIQKNYMTNLNPRYNTTMVVQGGISYWL